MYLVANNNRRMETGIEHQSLNTDLAQFGTELCKCHGCRGWKPLCCLQVTSAEIAIEKGEAEVALEAAIPALEEAAEALNDLKKDDITEIRSFAKPHILVQKVRFVLPCYCNHCPNCKAAE